MKEILAEFNLTDGEYEYTSCPKFRTNTPDFELFFEIL